MSLVVGLRDSGLVPGPAGDVVDASERASELSSAGPAGYAYLALDCEDGTGYRDVLRSGAEPECELCGLACTACGRRLVDGGRSFTACPALSAVQAKFVTGFSLAQVGAHVRCGSRPGSMAKVAGKWMVELE